MKVDILKGAKFVFVFFSVCLFLFSSCGLEEYIYVEGPDSSGRLIYPNYESFSTDRYFEFTTKETNQPDRFQGTAIYYKIYNNYSTMNSKASAIDNLNSSTNESAAATRMIDSYGYKELGILDNYSSPLVEDSNENKMVYIRLTNNDQAESNENKAFVIIGDDNIKKFNNDSSDIYDETSNPNGYKVFGIPRRAGNRYTFDFGRSASSWDNNENNALPSTEDTIGDYEESNSFSDDDNKVYYVDLFAVGVAQDDNFVKYYSKVLHLGSVKIDSSSEYN